MLKRHFARPGVKAINRDETNTARGVDLQFRVINYVGVAESALVAIVANISRRRWRHYGSAARRLMQPQHITPGDDVELQIFNERVNVVVADT